MNTLFKNKSGNRIIGGCKISNGPWAVGNGSGIVAVATSHAEALKIMAFFACSYIRPFTIAA